MWHFHSLAKMSVFRMARNLTTGRETRDFETRVPPSRVPCLTLTIKTKEICKPVTLE